ncbi:MAG TPA: GGDEF domain-containing protein, partial [Jatrophihabitans sp.]|nr:GGDEF domain-containing protein [Jatrophihabitans sp.]
MPSPVPPEPDRSADRPADRPADRVEQAIERARESADQRFRSVFLNAPVGMAVIDADGTLTEVNPALAAMLGRPVDELAGTSVFQWVHRDDRMGSRGRFTRLLAGASAVESSEVRVVRPDGELIWAHVSTSTLPDGDGGPTSFILQLQDVSARRTAEDRLKQQASTDELTGLANRATFTAHLQQAIEDAAPGAAGPAVLFLDLDRFKVVTASLGHGAGDRLLAQVAGRLRTCL